MPVYLYIDCIGIPVYITIDKNAKYVYVFIDYYIKKWFIDALISYFVPHRASDPVSLKSNLWI